jgi:hypothetical protein
MRTRRYWTPDELAQLRAMYADHPTREIAELLNRSERSIYMQAAELRLTKSAEYLASPAACRLRRGDNIGFASRFKKGVVPANKGLRRPGWASGRMRETQFKKGRPAHEARNYAPIGSLRLSKEGYLERKVTDDPALIPKRRWVSVHRLVWEAANGSIPPGHAVVFKAGRRSVDPERITLDCLELVSRIELMRRNSYHNRYPKEICLAIQLRGALIRKINRRLKVEKQD